MITVVFSNGQKVEYYADGVAYLGTPFWGYKLTNGDSWVATLTAANVLSVQSDHVTRERKKTVIPEQPEGDIEKWAADFLPKFAKHFRACGGLRYVTSPSFYITNENGETETVPPYLSLPTIEMCTAGGKLLSFGEWCCAVSRGEKDRALGLVRNVGEKTLAKIKRIATELCDGGEQ